MPKPIKTEKEKIDYLYKREKEREFEKCVADGMVLLLPLSLYTTGYVLEHWDRLIKEHKGFRDEVHKSCKVKVYGKGTNKDY